MRIRPPVEPGFALRATPWCLGFAARIQDKKNRGTLRSRGQLDIGPLGGRDAAPTSHCVQRSRYNRSLGYGRRALVSLVIAATVEDQLSDSCLPGLVQFDEFES